MIQIASQDPTVSVLIPVRNEERHIRRCIQNILETSYPQNKIEILVIDGRSDDRTREEVEFLRGQWANIVLLDNPKGMPYSGLNVGLSAAKGEVILRVDARSVCPRDYIRQCVATLLESGADNVGGVQMPVGVSAKQKAIALTMSHPFGVGNAQFRLGKRSGYVETVYLGCFRRDVFDRVGLYDEDGPVISEDSEMNQRIIRSGGKVYLNKDIVVSYVPKDTLKGYWKQYFIYGGARAHSVLRSGRFTSFRQLIPLAFLLTLILLVPLSFVQSAFLGLLILLVGTYLLVDLLVSVSLSVRQGGLRLMPWLFLAFPCMHLAWPLGFFVRLFEGSHPGAHWRR
jgi:glycosyltransferase involved in cell wall biosynthesis